MAANAPVPVYTSLDQIFPDRGILPAQGARYNALAEEFESHFGKRPTYIVRAPGRVNLIGDHIDYCLFGVLPAAIESDILMAVGPRDVDDAGRVTVQNKDSKYTRQTFAPVRVAGGDWSLDIDKTQLRWESYVKAGYYGVLEKFFKNNDEVPRPLDLLVTGSVPSGSGLSSSAAMVVASTLSFLAINDKLEGLSKGDVVEMTIKNETRVGVNSGGMDQSASVISSAEAALYISFHPKLSAEPIPLPITSPRSVFVCANSLVVSDKVVHSRTRYNLRAFESLVAARVLAHQLNIPIGKTEKLTLREFLDRWMGMKEGEEVGLEKLMKGLEKIEEKLGVLKLVESDGSDGTEVGVKLHEMVKLSGLSGDEFHDVYLSWVNIEAEYFQLYKRAKHVFSESLRVLQFREVCLRAKDSSSSSSSSEETLRELGHLMDESQRSCSELCDSSCPEVDLLCRLAKEAGAYGSRITGAGWGGCTVSLVDEARVPEFVEKLKKSYPPYHGLKGEELSEVIFATKPSSGASAYKL
ncbi:galactokinase gal [Fomitiporia mediterranea MF3/22]|uniref:galactokinase gal n=1 Tax=Fomitiporia mediterranea (strain MF3/22) TaxID=694068 RepID=UPI00044086F7|nr:galactokinase gal [Fomitiporia mediterranea MF3/22]EJD07056.1 galactokinase gal [Fomitiporia mediterranea MF3/22]